NLVQVDARSAEGRLISQVQTDALAAGAAGHPAPVTAAGPLALPGPVPAGRRLGGPTTVAGPCRGQMPARSGARSRGAGCVGPPEALRTLYYDTVTHEREPLADLIRCAGAGQVLLGSDRPFDIGTDNPADEVRALGLGAGEDLVLGANAARLLGVPGDLPT